MALVFFEEGMEDDEVEGNEEVEYFELVLVPDQVPDLVEVSKPQTLSKEKVQTIIASFAVKNKNMELILLFSEFFGRL